ncbi:MAG: potassium channel protein [Candidatus Bathyarchaeota archaeon]|nr:TrkA C-terminal domain-containing protein [Candidatus Bathyarchaeum tardum]WGM89333.1 MAG: TrkA C-terminal domain-containing protein [Candidatus Bathyarchaeum tardum]WNZ28392.1 MAG: potassium channel protein [Candidatus Bathyarchaeota archaeon]
MADSSKIEYRPISVRDALKEMKDVSEIMIDLAYSAALFNSDELAEEVMELEKRVDYLDYIINMNIMLAARDADDAKHLTAVSTVAAATNKVSDAAADIATIVLKNIGIHPIVRKAFEQVEERLGRAIVKSDSILINKTLGELELAAKLGVDIIAIRRHCEWIIDPEDDEKIVDGDVLISRGAPNGTDDLKALASGKLNELEE